MFLTCLLELQNQGIEGKQGADGEPGPAGNPGAPGPSGDPGQRGEPVSLLCFSIQSTQIFVPG